MSEPLRGAPFAHEPGSAGAARVALLAEDPGAAAFFAGVMASVGASPLFRLGACGAAARWFDAEAMPYEPINSLLTPLPCVVVAGTGEDPDGPSMRLLRTARAQGLMTVAVVDADIAVLDRFRARAEAAPLWPDHLIVVGARAAELLIEAGADAATVHQVGSAALDRLVSRRAPVPMSTQPPTLLFMAEPPSGYASLRLERDARYLLEGWSRPQGRTETVLEEVILALKARSARGLPPARLVVRPHPKCPPTQFDSYRGHLDAIEATGPSWRAILSASAVVGLTSAALDEAVVLERPTLSIVPVAQESAWLRSAATGLVTSVCDREAVQAALDVLLSAPILPHWEQVSQQLSLGGGSRSATLLRHLAEQATRRLPATHRP